MGINDNPLLRFIERMFEEHLWLIVLAIPVAMVVYVVRTVLGV